MGPTVGTGAGDAGKGRPCVQAGLREARRPGFPLRASLVVSVSLDEPLHVSGPVSMSGRMGRGTGLDDLGAGALSL